MKRKDPFEAKREFEVWLRTYLRFKGLMVKEIKEVEKRFKDFLKNY